MDKNNTRKHSFSLSKLAVLVGATLSVATVPVFAAEQAEEQESAEPIERIAITGSRIRSVNALAPSQITSISGEDLALTGHVNVMDALLDLPSVAGGLTSESAGFNYANTGMNTVNLRNLGQERTLVLVNGRRYVSSDVGEILADMNSIPTSLVERIDITTGGGSASYGSGAIAGVVNFILKRDFDGFEFEARKNQSGKGDNKSDLLRATIGGNFAEDKGNVVVNFERSTSDGLASRDRGVTGVRLRTVDGEKVLNPADLSTYAPTWRYDIGNESISWQNGVVGEWDQDKDGYRHADSRTISTPIDRTIVNALANYYLNDDVRVFGEFTYAKTETSNPSDLYAIGSAFRGAPISVDNPFVPDEIRKIALAENDAQFINYRGRLNEFGPGGFDAERVVTRVVLGFDGTFAEDWDWELSYNYGHVTNDQAGHDVNEVAFKKAIDVVTDPDTGDAVCRDEAYAAIGCVPTNVFEPFTQEMQNFWFNLTTLDGTLRQETLVASISNSNLFSLPAGSVGFAAGYEKRKEYAEEHPDSATKSGLTGGVQIDSLEGSYDVDEFFVEFDIPILADLEFAKSLGVNVAGRTTDYSHVGRNSSWQVSSRWEVSDDITFRAQYSEAFRAPTIADMFNGGTRQGLSIAGIDPCDGVSLTGAADGVSAEHASACRAIPGIANAIKDGGTFDGNPDDEIQRYSFFGPSPDLEVETAETTTVGFIYSPSYIKDLTISLDYYSIAIDNIITGVGNDYKAERCLEGLAEFCRAIERDSTTGVIQTTYNYVFNLAGREVEGVDLEASYKYSLGDYGDVNFKLLYNYVSKHQTKALPDSPWEDNLNELPYFEQRGNFSSTYRYEDLTVNWTTVYQGSIYDDKDASYFNNDIDAVVIHNAQVRYIFGDETPVEVYAGVDNVFDQDPPFLPEGYKHGQAQTATASSYSRIGRMLYLGTKIKF
ncbi:TonB-dependent receptor [Colwellia sp. D2M02]|uniref:TonB-dependent receptor domain-containing protein n=1 Tax=Colwellia sp. D2M02 TaxID=2841562 RepID=UPI001C098B79|nr:TonB-dependent receptor [Colwellia sp. D2M02]MBU2894904.1 TonB-dependent receptor [Colwellia sp. D2M02]